MSKNPIGNIVRWFLGLSIIASIIGGLVGCAAKSPEMVVANFSLAVARGDTTRARRYCTQNFFEGQFRTLDSEMATFYSTLMLMSGNEDFPKDSDLAENLESSISGDTARVWQTGVDFMVYILKKEGGGWKIDSAEMNMPDIPGVPVMPEGFPSVPGN
jgi:hypothetical protein